MGKVQQIIGEIHEKVIHVKKSLNRVETENTQLNEELDRLRGNLAKVEQEAADFRQKYNDAKDQLRNFETVQSTEDKDQEIDLLVREIDVCINRLKSDK